MLLLQAAHQRRNTMPLRCRLSAATAAAVRLPQPALAWLLAVPARTVSDALSSSTPWLHHWGGGGSGAADGCVSRQAPSSRLGGWLLL